jgi:hypothetical protein
MKKLSVLCIAICVCVPAAAFARGGMGSHGGMASHGMGGSPSLGSSSLGSSSLGSPATGLNQVPRTGQPFNTPGTNSLGTALSSSGIRSAQAKGPLLGTNAAIDREDAQVDRTVRSICRGC